MRGWFITGTDTCVGKTYVTTALARCARALDKRVFAFKPIETGCRRVNERLVGDDQTDLCHAAGDWQQGPLRGAYQFEVPAAPLVAAEHANTTIDLPRIVDLTREGSTRADLTVVEGAGGWRVPLTRQARMSDLAIAIGLPIIVVTRASLGTINHTLLTIEAVERDACEIAAIVMSQLPADDLELAASNAEQIRRAFRHRLFVIEADERVLEPLLI